MRAVVLFPDGRTVTFPADSYAEDAQKVIFFEHDGDFTRETGKFNIDQICGFCLKDK